MHGADLTLGSALRRWNECSLGPPQTCWEGPTVKPHPKPTARVWIPTARSSDAPALCRAPKPPLQSAAWPETDNKRSHPHAP